MADLRQALAELGHDIGIPELAPGPQGELQLRFPDTGALLGVSQHEDTVVVHYAEPVRYDIAALVLRAMRQAAKVPEASQAVQVGLRSTTSGDWLVLATRFAAHEAGARRIRQAADFLRQWLATLEP